MTELNNIADILPLRAEQLGEAIAIRCPGRRGSDGFARYDDCISYSRLNQRVQALARGFNGYGIGHGDRAVVMLKPSIDFFLVMFALLKCGAVPVLIDPGIARSALKQCLQEADAKAFIGIPLAHLAKGLFGWAPRPWARPVMASWRQSAMKIRPLFCSLPDPQAFPRACCTGIDTSSRRSTCLNTLFRLSRAG
jgi:non-ribosomal peptide synthetase component E (peptide arylation enzyme)